MTPINSDYFIPDLQLRNPGNRFRAVTLVPAIQVQIEVVGAKVNRWFDFQKTITGDIRWKFTLTVDYLLFL